MVSSEDVPYMLLFCGNEQELLRSGLQVPPSHKNVICEDPRFVDPCTRSADYGNQGGNGSAI